MHSEFGFPACLCITALSKMGAKGIPPISRRTRVLSPDSFVPARSVVFCLQRLLKPACPPFSLAQVHRQSCTRVIRGTKHVDVVCVLPPCMPECGATPLRSNAMFTFTCFVNACMRFPTLNSTTKTMDTPAAPNTADGQAALISGGAASLTLTTPSGSRQSHVLIPLADLGFRVPMSTLPTAYLRQTPRRRLFLPRQKNPLLRLRKNILSKLHSQDRAKRAAC